MTIDIDSQRTVLSQTELALIPMFFHKFSTGLGKIVPPVVTEAMLQRKKTL
jgi:hypothetical protein